MKGNLKEQVADLQKELQELTKRFGTLQDRIENYMVPHLQKMSRELVELKDKIKPEIVVDERQAGLRGTPQRCDRCEYVKVVANEDQQPIGICNNPLSMQYEKEVLGEENCWHFSPNLKLFSKREDDSK